MNTASPASLVLIPLYLSIGREIVARQGNSRFGSETIERLSHDLQAYFPGLQGFSPNKINYMRAFAEAWPDYDKVSHLIELLPWGHHRVLLDAFKDPTLREWYLRTAVEFGWNRSVLVLQIKNKLHVTQVTGR